MEIQIKKNILISFILCISFLISSCDKTVEPENPKVNTTYSYFSAMDYMEGYYFLDEVYFDTTNGESIFSKIYNSSESINDDSISFYKIKSCQVWYAAQTNLVSQRTKISARSFFNIKAKKYGNIYEKEYRERPVPQDEENWKYLYQHNFYLLNQGKDYEFDPFAGYIKLKFPVLNDEAIAVAYRIEGPTYEDYDDITYGEFLEEFVSNEPVSEIMLKLIKPKDLVPDMKEAWVRKLKNVYRISSNYGLCYRTDIQISVKNKDGEYVDIYMNKPFIEYFDLDKKSVSGENKPDGIIDFNSRNVDVSDGIVEIVFPQLFPFDEQFPRELPESMRLNSLYTITKAEYFKNFDSEKIRFLVKEYYP